MTTAEPPSPKSPEWEMAAMVANNQLAFAKDRKFLGDTGEAHRHAEIAEMSYEAFEQMHKRRG